MKMTLLFQIIKVSLKTKAQLPSQNTLQKNQKLKKLLKPLQ